MVKKRMLQNVKTMCLGAREMGLQIRTLISLPETPGWIPCIHMIDHNYNSSSRGSNIIFWPHALGTYTTQTYMQTKHPRAWNKQTKNLKTVFLKDSF